MYKIIRAMATSSKEPKPWTCSDDAVYKLELQVNDMLEKGWKPQGGVSVNVTVYDDKDRRGKSFVTTVVTAYQAMIKEENEGGGRFLWETE